MTEVIKKKTKKGEEPSMRKRKEKVRKEKKMKKKNTQMEKLSHFVVFIVRLI